MTQTSEVPNPLTRRAQVMKGKGLHSTAQTTHSTAIKLCTINPSPEHVVFILHNLRVHMPVHRPSRSLRDRPG